MSAMRAFVLLFVAQISCVAVAQAQSENVLGKWNIEITFGDGAKHSLRFHAQEGGKGTLELLDPISNVWGAATSSKAKWSQGGGNAVTLSGPVEFMLGNVGRDAGTLMLENLKHRT